MAPRFFSDRGGRGREGGRQMRGRQIVVTLVDPRDSEPEGSQGEPALGLDRLGDRRQIMLPYQLALSNFMWVEPPYAD